ncbi:MAG: DUF502 domain-containing protein [Candidatus Marinimicrobia bacterium]|nr:DUF502 domain-containing protein [Candidatus Neomarinimicrobiota bacterium]
MNNVAQNIRRKLLTGFFAMAPIALTLYILKLMFSFLDKLTSPILRQFNVEIPGLGILLTLILLFMLGVLVTNVLGRTLLVYSEKIISAIPLVKTIYKTVKQITQALSGTSGRSFQKVVYVEYPRRDLWTLAFVTGDSVNENGVEFYHLFVPTTPNPTSGVFILVPKTDTIEAGMSIENGLKTIISGGMLAPKKHSVGIYQITEDTK